MYPLDSMSQIYIVQTFAYYMALAPLHRPDQVRVERSVASSDGV